MVDLLTGQDDDGQHVLLERVRGGADSMVIGEREAVRRMLSEAAAALGADARIVRASAPPGGLSLSNLMAQLSGRDDLGDHDDSVLEDVFRLLSGAGGPNGRAVLMLDACEGLQRSVLQYVHQAGRVLPGLSFVIGAMSLPEALEETPGLLGLRARLLRFDPVVARALPQPVPLSAALGGLAFRAGRWPETAPRYRAVGSWALTGMGMAASLVIGVIVGHATTPRAEREAWPVMTRAAVPVPALASVEAPAGLSVPLPTLAATPEAPAPAARPKVALATVAAPLPTAAATLNLASSGQSPAAAPPPNRAAPVVVGLLQEGGGDGGWSGPARVLAERPSNRRSRPSPVRSRPMPPVAGPDAFEAAEPFVSSPLSPHQVEEVRSHFRARPGWNEPAPVPAPPYDGDW